MNFFHNTPGSLYSLFPKSSRHEKLFFHIFNMTVPATFFAIFPVNKHLSALKSYLVQRSKQEFMQVNITFGIEAGGHL